MWRREKRKFIKLHIMADRKGKVVGFRVTSERTGDTKKFVPLVKDTVRKKGNVTKAYAAYDSKKNFNLLERLGIEPAINLRENAVANSEGSYARKQEVFNRLGREGWKRAKEYGGWWRYSSRRSRGSWVTA
ncbi:MAG: transposase [Conexivisphaerales archaeon]